MFIAYKSILSTKLQSFQYYLNLRILYTNSMLMKCGLSETELCSYCFEIKESLIHLFYECRFVHKSFQTSCPINHFSFYSTNIYIVTNDNIRQVLRISQFGSNRTPSVHSTGVIFILMPHLDLRFSVNCSQRERTNRHS
jgi:hypothetical protein